MTRRHFPSFSSQYHGKHWQVLFDIFEGSFLSTFTTDKDFEENERSSRCFIAKVKFTDNSESMKDDEILFLSPEMKNLPELQPPNIMPRGNVGTSTKYFLQAIKECRMSSKLIGKLKLEFPKSR